MWIRWSADALKAGKKLSLAAQTYLLRNANVDDLLKMERSEAVYRAILSRDNAPADALRESLAGLATIRNVGRAELLLALIDQRDADDKADGLAPLAGLLVEQPPAELRGLRARLVNLATHGKTAPGASWATPPGSWRTARPTMPLRKLPSPRRSLAEVLAAIPRIASAELRRPVRPSPAIAV